MGLFSGGRSCVFCVVESIHQNSWCLPLCIQCQSEAGVMLISPWDSCKMGSPGSFLSRVCARLSLSTPLHPFPLLCVPSTDKLTFRLCGPTELALPTFTGGAAFPDSWPYTEGSFRSPRYGLKAMFHMSAWY